MKRAAQTFNAPSFVFMKKEHMGLEQHGGENIISGLLILWSWLFSWLWHHCKTIYEIQMQQHGILDIFQWNPFICFSEAPPCVLLWSECVAVGGQWRTVGILSLTHTWTLSLWSDLWLVGLSWALHDHEKLPHELYVSCLCCDPMTLSVLNLHRTAQLFSSHASALLCAAARQHSGFVPKPKLTVYIGSFLLRQHSTLNGTS